MTEKEVQSILLNKLKFSQDAYINLIYLQRSIEYNQKFNLNIKSTENIWDRHI